MTFIIPVGRPLYEGLVSPKAQEPASPAPKASGDERARDEVRLSPQAQAYLQSQALPPVQAEAPAQPPQRLLDKTV